MREAVRLGVKAVEIDISITSDGEPVIMHDNTVDRTTDGTGKDIVLSYMKRLSDCVFLILCLLCIYVVCLDDMVPSLH